jgi:hypothetical protein
LADPQETPFAMLALPDIVDPNLTYDWLEKPAAFDFPAALLTPK